MDNRYLPPDAAARYLSVSKDLLRRWRKRGTGPEWVRLNRLIRYSPESLAAFLAANTHGEKSL